VHDVESNTMAHSNPNRSRPLPHPVRRRHGIKAWAVVAVLAAAGSLSGCDSAEPTEDDFDRRMAALMQAQDDASSALSTMATESSDAKLAKQRALLDAERAALEAAKAELEHESATLERDRTQRRPKTTRTRRDRTRADKPAATADPASPPRGRRIKIVLNGDGDPMDA
jgi:hypothetical protein